MEELNRSFKDNEGREWHLKITALSAMRLRDEIGVDLNNVAAGDNKFLQDLMVDTWKIVEVLDVLTASRRKELGIERDDFLESLADDVLDNAVAAFINAIVLFSRPLARPALQEVVRQMTSGVETASQKLANKIRDELPGIMEQNLDKGLSGLTFGE